MFKKILVGAMALLGFSACGNNSGPKVEYGCPHASLRVNVKVMDEDGNPVWWWETGGARPGGDFITVKLFNELAQEYLNGPYVAGITASTLTLSHIMMQKYVHILIQLRILIVGLSKRNPSEN